MDAILEETHYGCPKCISFFHTAEEAEECRDMCYGVD